MNNPTHSKSRTTAPNNKNLLHVSLCDSRSCHQQGGGLHLKADLEDLVQLVPNADGRRVQLTTCMGLCNRSPNVLLKSRGKILLYSHQQRLVNDGGFRMRLDKDDDNHDVTTSHKVIVSEMSIRKVARVLGLLEGDQHQNAAVRAIEYKAAGNRFLLKGNYPGALRQFSLGIRSVLLHHDQKTISSLAASLWLLRIQCRVQWATSTTENHHHRQQQLSSQEAMDALRLAVIDALCMLTASHTAACLQNSNHEDGISDLSAQEFLVSEEEPTFSRIHNVITRLLQTDAAAEIQTMMDGHDDDDGDTAPPVTLDVTILAHVCVALADAWSALAEIISMEEMDALKEQQQGVIHKVLFRQAALAAYTEILAATTTNALHNPTHDGTKKKKKKKVFKIRVHRRITRCIAALEDHCNTP